MAFNYLLLLLLFSSYFYVLVTLKFPGCINILIFKYEISFPLKCHEQDLFLGKVADQGNDGVPE